MRLLTSSPTRFAALLLLWLATGPLLAQIMPDNYDVLFLKCDGTNNQFVDSSTANPKTVTANGNATQLPIKFNRTAGFFNGTTDYVVVPHHADLTFGTGDFDIEFFLNCPPESFSTYRTIYSKGYSAGAVGVLSGGFLIMIAPNAKLMLYGPGSSGQRIISSATMQANTWTHFRISRAAGVVTMYQDGVPVGTYIGTDNYDNTSDVRLGWPNTGATGYEYVGWMKELRVSNTVRSNSVPTSPYPPDPNTKLLMHFDSPATSPLGPSICFDGNGDYLQIPASADWAFGNAGSGDFTLEAFVNFYNLGVDGTVHGLFSVGTAGGPGWGFTYYQDIDAAAGIGLYSQGAVSSYAYHKRFTQNKWTHIAIVRSGSNLYLYLDGQKMGTSFTDANFTNSSDPLYIGKYNSVSTFSYMREIRISKVARYTANFTPSQTGFTLDSNTKLYIKGNEPNGSSCVLSNGSFEDGDLATGWTLYGAGATAARDGTTRKIGSYSEKVTRNGADLVLSQDFSTSKGIDYWKGRTVTLGCWVYATGANRAFITVGDNTTGMKSSYHTGDSTWQWLTATHTCNPSATSLSAGMWLTGGDASAYFDGATVYSHSISDSSATPGKVVEVNGDTVIKYTEDYRSCIFNDSGTWNYALNGSFENWSSTYPEGWARAAGTGATIAKETTIVKLGVNSAKVVTAAQDTYLEQQNLHTSKGIDYWKGRTVTFGCWVYCPSGVRKAWLNVADGASGTLQVTIDIFDRSH